MLTFLPDLPTWHLLQFRFRVVLQFSRRFVFLSFLCFFGWLKSTAKDLVCNAHEAENTLRGQGTQKGLCLHMQGDRLHKDANDQRAGHPISYHFPRKAKYPLSKCNGELKSWYFSLFVISFYLSIQFICHCFHERSSSHYIFR